MCNLIFCVKVSGRIGTLLAAILPCPYILIPCDVATAPSALAPQSEIPHFPLVSQTSLSSSLSCLPVAPSRPSLGPHNHLTLGLPANYL